ncbi:MAG: hypothetical protein V1755_06325 [Chloroflexota bacterium]
MAERIRNATPRSTRLSDRGPSTTAYPMDVLLIADEPRRPGRGRGGRPNQGGITSQSDESTEPLDMESVVRRLIALLSEESEP